MKPTFFNLKSTLFAIALATTSALQTHAATNSVAVGSGGLVFVPANPVIAQGDTIIWTWSGPNHSTTGTNGGGGNIWDSGVHSPTFSFTNTFPTAGAFPYICTVHVNFGMKGTVTVNAAVPTRVASTITAAKFVGSNSFQLTYTTTNGASYSILKSPIITATNWPSLGTNVATSASSIFVDTNAISTPAYYKIQSL